MCEESLERRIGLALFTSIDKFIILRAGQELGHTKFYYLDRKPSPNFVAAFLVRLLSLGSELTQVTVMLPFCVIFCLGPSVLPNCLLSNVLSLF